ncbi:hypothetical protein ACTMU2_00930 [Cupriavidus basilensis]
MRSARSAFDPDCAAFADRSGERHRHFLLCTAGGALALAALDYAAFAEPGRDADHILSVAAVLIFAAPPVF